MHNARINQSCCLTNVVFISIATRLLAAEAIGQTRIEFTTNMVNSILMLLQDTFCKPDAHNKCFQHAVNPQLHNMHNMH